MSLKPISPFLYSHSSCSQLLPCTYHSTILELLFKDSWMHYAWSSKHALFAWIPLPLSSCICFVVWFKLAGKTHGTARIIWIYELLQIILHFQHSKQEERSDAVRETYFVVVWPIPERFKRVLLINISKLLGSFSIWGRHNNPNNLLIYILTSNYPCISWSTFANTLHQHEF